MSCRQSKKQTRSYPSPGKSFAEAAAKTVLSGTPASAARAAALSTDAWL
jgi:hypothetical protein